MVWLVVLCVFSMAPDEAEAAPGGVTHAVLINGGSRPHANYLSHLHHLQGMVELLESRGVPHQRQHIFSADGEDEAPDLAGRDALPAAFWLLADTRVGRLLRPRLEVINTRWDGVPLQPARQAILQQWFATVGRDLVPGDRLFIFVTDHGTWNHENPDNGAISLWREQLTVAAFRHLLAGLRPGVQTVLVMSQCYSGTFATAMYDDSGPEPSGQTCGFFSTRRDLQAYGCYPEGREHDRLGHAFRFIDALRHHPTTAAAHLEVLLTDDSPDVPVRTSDLYLERLVAQEAAARGLDLDVLVDGVLAEAWQERTAWAEEMRLLDRIGAAFGTDSPRSLAALEAAASALRAASEQVKTSAEQWHTTLVTVREENLRSFLSAWPQWQELLREAALQALTAEDRKALLAELLPALEWHTQHHPENWQRLTDLHARARQAAEARWHLDVQQAALRRMRALLVNLAGRVLLAKESEAGTRHRTAQRQALDKLERCEAFALGELPAARLAALPHSPEPFPPLAEEQHLPEKTPPMALRDHAPPVPRSLPAERPPPAATSWLQASRPAAPAEEERLEAQESLLTRLLPLLIGTASALGLMALGVGLLVARSAPP